MDVPSAERPPAPDRDGDAGPGGGDTADDDAPEVLSSKRRMRDALRANALLRRRLRRYRADLLLLFQDKYFLCERLVQRQEAPR